MAATDAPPPTTAAMMIGSNDSAASATATDVGVASYDAGDAAVVDVYGDLDQSIASLDHTRLTAELAASKATIDRLTAENAEKEAKVCGFFESVPVS